MMAYREFQDDQIEEMIRRLADGEPMALVAKDRRMPSYESMHRWQEDKENEIGRRIARARAQGYQLRAAQAVQKAAEANDPARGRLAFDAERWYLSKMDPSKFGDKVALTDNDGGPLQVVLNKPGNDDAKG